MRKIIDLSAVNEKYIGGVRAFSLDLSREMKRQDPQIKFIVSRKNKSFITQVLNLKEGDILAEVDINISVKLLMGLFSLIAFISRSKLCYELGVKLVRRLFHIIKVNDDDIVYVPTTNTNFLTVSKNTILSIHDIQHIMIPSNFSKLERIKRTYRSFWSMNEASIIQVSSRYMGNCIIDYDNTVTRKIRIINEFNRFSDYASLATRESKKKSDLIIFYPANFWIHKNHKLIFEALNDVNWDFNYKLILTGNDFGKFREMSKNIRFNCEYLGIVSDKEIIDLYNSADIVLMASMHESSSLPVIEGYGFGCSIVASNIEPCLEFDESYQIYLFDPNDHNSLREALNIAVNELSIKQPIVYRDFNESYGLRSVATRYLEIMKP